MDKNAIILAAGKSNRFAPFTYEKPKGLFRVKGEILIERQIEQLIEAGIINIYIVVGYMKEKFFYLESKYNVKLIVNNEFGRKGNLYSLFVARKYIGNTFICCADHYFVENPFFDNNNNNLSYRACAFQSGKFREFAVSISEANVITNVEIGGIDSWAMVGPAYVNDSFGNKFVKLLEDEIDDFGIAQMFWEEFYSKHIRELTFYRKVFSTTEMLEFENIDDLRTFDSEFLLNVDSEIIANICSVLGGNPNLINNIEIISAGLTNVSFSFYFSGNRYVYRHPGGTAGNLIDREAEIYSQTKARKLEIDNSFIAMDKSGWKISHYIKEARNCNFEKYPEQLNIAMDYLRVLHKVEVDSEIKIFDNLEEGKKLMRIASATKGNLFREFSCEVAKAEKLYFYIKNDAKRLNYNLVLCHNDAYEPNYIIDSDGKIFLIDWEYAGLNYAANDVCCITCRYDWSKEKIENYFKAYMNRELSYNENRFFWAFHCICAFYWFNWGLYKGSVGDDDGFFFLPAYRNFIKYIDKAIASYEE